MDAFDRATRRLMRRLGTLITLEDEAGNTRQVKADIIQAEEFIAKTKGSTLSLKLDNPVLQFATTDCPHLTKQWVVELNGQRYEIADDPLIEHGQTQIPLIPAQVKTDLGWLNEP
ncbi:hypothetical protein H0A36_28605 [Endozoicomonas sp. SM1973]|uniref:Phage protein n=1 Tax=Spartinivicinus marinus TaxID=2994442 RepID=A0A853IAL5_9GAMM|nr:hypothetical protein [Spartinivicinus marinus]NYZ69979.1 hypothetical protein [Spartinivicinus marinus]